MFTRVIQGKRPRPLALLAILGALVAAGMFAAVALALVSDGTSTLPNDECDIQVDDRLGSEFCTTDAGAAVRYIGDSSESFGSSGTGTFNPFVRLQGSPTEDGYNTNGTVQFETKTGKWTHAILISEIPIRTEDGCTDCFELFVDINEGNNAKPISLNEMEIWFSDNDDLTGYPFAVAGTSLEYDFSGEILINDVNQGSGRGDLRYMIPTADLDIPSNCNYGNDLCETYFLVYSEWGTSGGSFGSEGGFEEWKVKVYPVVSTTLTTVSQTPANPVVPGTAVTIVVRETNTGDDTLENVFVSGTGCTVWTPANVASLAPGAFADFTCTFSPTADTAWTADGHGTDSDGNPAPTAGEHTSGNVDVNDTTTASSAQDWLPNDTATITSAGGTALNGSLTIALYTGDNCGVTSGSAVAGQSYPFTLVNEASGTAHSTNNTTYKVSATGSFSWLVTFTSTDPAVQSDSHCESTALTITN